MGYIFIQIQKDLNIKLQVLLTMDRPPPEESDIKLDNMSRQDLKKIEKSMKRPQFLGLLNEYMIEISDPKNKNEYDEYLRQMEREKELPKHMKIVELKPKFCFRTFIVSQKNKKHEMKFFINMCETQYLEKPGCEPSPGEDGKVGYNWKIPNSSGKIRYDQDKKGSPCQVIDVAFNPDTFLFAAARKQFQEMIINIALEAAEKQLGERKESLSRDYVILKNVICKGQDGKPALMPIRYIEGKVYNKGEGPSAEPQRDNEGRETKLQKEINKQKEEHDKNKKQKDQKPKDEAQVEQQEAEDKKLVVDLSEGVQRPKYSTIFTYPVDYSEFMENPAMNTRRKVPSAFNIEFSIPRVESISEIADQKLEINDKKIILKIGQKYFIDLQLQEFKLKYVIQTASAKAKYDKKKKCLRIIIPIDQSINYHPQQVHEAPSIKENEEAKPDIVESQVWKNKMLDFTEPSVSVKMLNNEDTEEKPKLIEEIDQEDEITEAKPNVQKVEEEQEGEYTSKKQQKFSVSNYYKKSESEAVNNIKYVFQETADKIVLVLQMKNYKKEEISTIVSGNCDLLLEWKQAGKEASFYHLRVKEQFVSKVLKIEVRQMINFVAFTLTKSEKGKYWEKSSIEEVIYISEGEKGRYQSFRQVFNRFQQAQREVQIVEKAAIQAKAATKAIEQPKIPEQRKLEAEPQEPLEDEPKALPSAAAEPQKNRANIFNNLQVQFITFNAPFIDILD